MTQTISVLSPHSCRAARKLLELTQEEFADLAGISVSSLRRFESGASTSSSTRDRIEEAFDKQVLCFVRAHALHQRS